MQNQRISTIERLKYWKDDQPVNNSNSEQSTPPASSATSRRQFLQSTSAAAAALAILPELSWGSVLRLSEPLNVAVIGVGRQGRAILAELQKIENVNIVVICDADASRLRSGQRRVQGVDGVADYHAVLHRSDVQAVIIATPTHLHKQIAIDALAAGKPVYCEGPLAHTIADCHAIAKAARGANTIFQTGMQGRCNPVYTLANSFKRSGAIRDAIGARAQYHRKTTWQSAGGSNAAERKARNWKLDPEVSLGLEGEYGTHQFDVVHWFLGKYPKSVRGTGAVRAYDDGRKVADTISCSFEFGGGMNLLYDATIGNSYEGQYEQIMGTMGLIKLAWSHGWLFKEADAPTQGWEVYANRQQFHNTEGITLIADATKLASQGKLKDGIGLPHPSLYYSLEAFVKSVAEDAPVACSADEGMRAAIVGICAHEAVKNNTEVAIGEDLFKIEG